MVMWNMVYKVYHDNNYVGKMLKNWKKPRLLITVFIGSFLMFNLYYFWKYKHVYIMDMADRYSQNGITFPQKDGLKILNQRKKILQKVCNNQKSKSSKIVNLQKLVVYDKHKLILCKLAKVGSQYWRRLIESQSNGSNSTGRGLLSYSPAEQAYRLQNYYKIMIVREPFSRLWSAYNDKFVNMNYKFIRPYTRDVSLMNKSVTFPKSYCNNHVDFVEFSEYIIWKQLTTQPANAHWRTFLNACLPCDVNYDFIVKLETFASDLKTFLNITNMKPPLNGKDGKMGLIEAACRKPFKNATKLEMMHCGKPRIIKNAVLRHWYNVGIISERLLRKLIEEPKKKQGAWIQNGFFTSTFYSDLSKNENELLSQIKQIDWNKFNELDWSVSCQSMLHNFLGSGGKQASDIKHLKEKVKNKAFSDLTSKVVIDLLRIYKVDFELFGYDYHKYHIE